MKQTVEQWVRRRSGLRWLVSLCVGLLLGVGLFVSSASATVMKHADLPRLVEISDVIVHGTVAQQDTYFDEEQNRVVTDVTIEIKQNFYGGSGDTVTFQQWRGFHDGKHHIIPGDATFEDGEEVVVFLRQGDDGVTALSALGQAKYSVERSGNKSLVIRDLSDIAFLVERPGGEQEITHFDNEKHSLPSFVATLEALVSGIKGGGQ